MPDPATLRDSTQIVLPRDAIDGMRADLRANFTVTIEDRDAYCRIIASPVVIKAVGDYLSRHGVPVR